MAALARGQIRCQGDAKGAVEAYTKLLLNWKNADPNIPALAEAKGVVLGVSAR